MKVEEPRPGKARRFLEFLGGSDSKSHYLHCLLLATGPIILGIMVGGVYLLSLATSVYGVHKHKEYADEAGIEYDLSIYMAPLVIDCLGLGLVVLLMITGFIASCNKKAEKSKSKAIVIYLYFVPISFLVTLISRCTILATSELSSFERTLSIVVVTLDVVGLLLTPWNNSMFKSLRRVLFYGGTGWEGEGQDVVVQKMLISNRNHDPAKLNQQYSI